MLTTKTDLLISLEITAVSTLSQAQVQTLSKSARSVEDTFLCSSPQDHYDAPLSLHHCVKSIDLTKHLTHFWQQFLGRGHSEAPLSTVITGILYNCQMWCTNTTSKQEFFSSVIGWNWSEREREASIVYRYLYVGVGRGKGRAPNWPDYG